MPESVRTSLTPTRSARNQGAAGTSRPRTWSTRSAWGRARGLGAALGAVLSGAIGCSGGDATSATASSVVTARAPGKDAGSDAAAVSEVLPPPACEEIAGGAWERAIAGERGIAKVVGASDGRTLGGMAQAVEGRGTIRLRFLGTHVFDLLDKIAAEGGATEGEKRRAICAVLNEAARSGAPVVRIWGTLKRTGTTAEIERARETLALVLDEDARRARPLRFVVSLLNHQPGYGLPDPEVSLDDQKAAGWSAREVYLERSWERRGIGQLAERIQKYREDKGIRGSAYVIGWELVNELDTHRSVGGGALAGAEAEKLAKGFLVPAAGLLAESFPQPIAIGDLRGGLGNYRSFGEGLVEALSQSARERLVWTGHVYIETTNPPPTAAERRAMIETGTRKIDLDLEIARKLGLPFLLGEIGQLVRGAKTAYCRGGAVHDIPTLLSGVLSPESDPHGRGEIEAALFWGEGMCGLPVESGSGGAGRRMDIGAGGDSADLGPGEAAARKAVVEARGWPRFVAR